MVFSKHFVKNKYSHYNIYVVLTVLALSVVFLRSQGLIVVHSQSNEHWSCPTGSTDSRCEFFSIQKAVNAASSGDTIRLIDGTYRECAIIPSGKNGLKILGSNGTYVRDVICNGHGIFEVKSENVTIENIECSGASNTSNGSCVWLVSGSITLRNVYFHDNEEGMITGNSVPGTILVENSRFERNGFNSGLSHGVYVGEGADNFIIRNSTFLSPKGSGVLIKSRAKRTTIEGSTIAALNGKGGRIIDIANGGFLTIRNNVIEARNDSGNRNTISIALERRKNRYHSLGSNLIENNWIICDRINGCDIFDSLSEFSIDVKNNKLVGPGIVWTSATDVSKTDASKINDQGGNIFYKNRSKAGLGAFPALPPVPGGSGTSYPSLILRPLLLPSVTY